ncbi:unnamed protein product [Parascedosporium putredinis]|uniref:DUF1168-domain-containing protein n=1 Tax=Parascedosporium putredinis TaxID=1442378 RepID=A0A9P1H7F0_9PEZI|nr:unnamed protein product [Parascedosporium putredinis]CAI8001169.1 unnamed protein product [Parascedosporium putredinis]
MIRTTNAPRRPVTPDIVTNVQGSSAGAGSGEFHVYKAARRREADRLRRMDEEARNESAQRKFEQDKVARETKDDEKTRKNREKREKMKARKAKARLVPKTTPGDDDRGDADTADGQGATVLEDIRVDAPKNNATAVSAGSSGKPNGDDNANEEEDAPGLIIHDED